MPWAVILFLCDIHPSVTSLARRKTCDGGGGEQVALVLVQQRDVLHHDCCLGLSLSLCPRLHQSLMRPLNRPTTSPSPPKSDPTIASPIESLNPMATKAMCLA
ncbi:hypothetical protein CC2G_005345 [Coprinopsis cinerea AmutBmut pab1-1]|nr:hypothetical protein CC2G_005345 [Coprinopsis cinerea AmutBmut pab1-1]